MLPDRPDSQLGWRRMGKAITWAVSELTASIRSPYPHRTVGPNGDVVTGARAGQPYRPQYRGNRPRHVGDIAELSTTGVAPRPNRPIGPYCDAEGVSRREE